MHMHFYSFGKLKDKALAQLAHDYLQRIQRFHPCIVEEIPDEKINTKPLDKILETEAQRFLKRLKPQSYLILFDAQGSQLSSEAFAEHLAQQLQGPFSEIAFLIGSAHGVHPEIKQRANYSLSLSKLTFPHQLAQLIALEQIYRAWTLMKNVKYHY